MFQINCVKCTEMVYHRIERNERYKHLNYLLVAEEIRCQENHSLDGAVYNHV